MECLSFKNHHEASLKTVGILLLEQTPSDKRMEIITQTAWINEIMFLIKKVQNMCGRIK